MRQDRRFAGRLSDEYCLVKHAYPHYEKFEEQVEDGKYDLLKEWVLHNVADQAPDRVMREKESIQRMEQIGCTEVKILHRENVEAVLVATTPRY